MLGQTKYSASDFRKEWDSLRDKAYEQHTLNWHDFAAKHVSTKLSLAALEFMLSDQKEVFFGQWLKDAAAKRFLDIEMDKMLKDG